MSKLPLSYVLRPDMMVVGYQIDPLVLFDLPPPVADGTTDSIIRPLLASIVCLPDKKYEEWYFYHLLYCNN